MSSSHEHLNKLWYKNNSKLFFRPIIPFITNYFASVNNFTGKLLDIGCGTGEKANALSKIGFDVTGIEGDCDRVEKAKKDYPGVNFMCYHMENKLPFMDNTFDVVFSNSVFQYIEHESMLSECKRILKPGGCIILIENLKNNPITKFGRTYRKKSGHNYHSYPYNHFTYKEINALSNEFNNAALNYFHFLTPLSQLKVLGFLYSPLRKADKLLLRNSILQRLSWIVLFEGVNKK